MGGKMSAAWWRDYRRRNGERVNAQLRARRSRGRNRGDRSREYAKRPTRANPRPTPLYPHLKHGSTVSWWHTELAMDLEQERELARLEGRDPEDAVARYRARELRWFNLTVPLVA
jgi:hypothetical protein